LNSQVAVLVNELDPDKKNPEWGNTCISAIRMYWRQLKNVSQARENRAIMYSMQPLCEVADSFDDEDFKKNVKFLPVPVLEPIINSIVEDLVRNPPRAELRAEDPTAINEKKEDIEKLRNRYILERDRSELQSRIGFGQYQVPYDKFNGNVEEFDKLGLDETDPDDVNFYEQNYQRLWYEIGGQSLISNVIKYNRFDKNTIRRLVKDVFWAKAVCTQTFVDQITGEIKFRYIDPQTCWGIFGYSNDGKDDVARGWQDTVTVQEFLEKVGNEFDWGRDWRQLLWGINYYNNFRYTGFIRGGVSYDCFGDAGWMDKIGCAGAEQPMLLDWSQAYLFKVSMGYIEWKSIEATSTKIIDYKNPTSLEYVPYSYVLKKKQAKEGYQKESRFQQQWYCSYFLATSSISQYVYRFQKVYYQKIEGVNDEYSNGTLAYYQEEGKSAVDVAKVYLQIVNFCYYRMLWIIYKAKPDADEFVYEEMVQLAQKVQNQFPQAGTNAATPKIGDVINNLIKEMRQKHVRLRTYPRIDGKPVAQIYPIEKQGTGGLDPLALAMQAIQSWAEGQIAAKIGINPMRIGANPPSRESTESESMTLQASYATTGYMYRMIQYLKEHLCVAALNYSTDILSYPDTLPYKWLQTLMGNERFEALKSLGKFCAHRYGLYIDDVNSELDRRDLKEAASLALSKGQISLTQWQIIINNPNPKLGFKILAHMELKTKKKERRQALQDQQIALQIEQQKHGMKMEELSFQRETVWGVADREGQALVASAQVQAQARIQVKELQNENEIPKQMAKTQGGKEIEETKANLKQQEPIIE
jgi:hypothetical protein